MLFAATSQPAFAQNGSVVIPTGEWAQELISYWQPVFALAIAFLLRKLPGDLGNWLLAMRVDQLLANSIGHGINATPGAQRGAVLTVPVGNKVLEQAMEFAKEHAPRLVRKLGGDIRLREKITARLNLEAAAEVKPVATTV